MKLTLFNLSFCFLILSFQSYCQNFKISGKLVDAEKGTPLESATIFAETLIDSTLITYTISNNKGGFELTGKAPNQNIKFYISSIGYKTYEKQIDISLQSINLEEIKLEIEIETLGDVIIKSKQAPITIKKDTLEFNSSFFKTKKDANVEDLLKKLPGIEVDHKGGIKVNGKIVDKILVNGKPFFSNDPTIATRNLTKDITYKIQVSDTKTDSEAFAGKKGEQKNKTINIVIEKDKNKGVFGRIAAGGGTNKRYELIGMINFFNDDRQLSFLSGGNNTNSPGFNSGDIHDMHGSPNNAGIITSRNIGINYADNISKKTSITTDYFYKESNAKNDNTTRRENILANSRFYDDANSKLKINDNSHRVNLNFRVEIDSTFLINLSPSINTSKSKNKLESTNSSASQKKELVNSSSLFSNGEIINKSFSNFVNLTKRFGNQGSYLMFSIDNQFDIIKSNTYLKSNTKIFGDNPEIINRDQLTNGDDSQTGLNTYINYNYPIIANKLFVAIEYRYLLNTRKNIANTFDFDKNDQKYSKFNTLLSTDIKFRHETKASGLNISYEGKDTFIGIYSKYMIINQQNTDKLRNLNYNQVFTSIELSSQINHKISARSSINMGYYLNNTPPDLSQIQTFKNVSDPLHTITGNPNLKSSNNHNLSIGYNNYDYQKNSGFTTLFSIGLIKNKIVPKTIIDDNLLKNTTFDNLNGDYSLNNNIEYNKTFKIDTLRSLDIRLSLVSEMNKVINFNNNVKYASKNLSISPSLDLVFNWNKVLEVIPNYRVSINNSNYDVKQFDNQNFTNHSVGLKTTTYFPKNLEWNNDISYNYNPNVSIGFQKSAWFWNSTISYSIFKNKGMVALKIYDLLNQNTDTRRFATENYIEDIQNTVLRQYFMLSFSYKFNSLKGGVK